MHWPNGYGYDDRYFQMLTAERVATRYSFGKPYKVFECPAGARNEALDIRVYNYAAAVSLNPAWEALRAHQSPKLRIETVPHSERDPAPVSGESIQKELTAPAAGYTPRRRTSGTGVGFVNNY